MNKNKETINTSTSLWPNVIKCIKAKTKKKTIILTIFQKQLYDRIVTNNNSKSYYENLLKTASNYEEWCDAATKLDEIDGLDKWKREMSSPDYDHELVKTRLDQLRNIRKSNKGQSAMIFALRTSLARNLGDMGNPKVLK